MDFLNCGLQKASEVTSKGREITVEQALRIADVAHEAIERGGKNAKSLHDVWGQMQPLLAELMPSQSHALVAVWQIGQSSPYGEVLIGNHPQLHIDTISRAAQWMRVSCRRKNTNRFFIVYNPTK